MKRTSLRSGLLVFLAGLAACGGGSTPDAGVPDAEETRQNVRVLELVRGTLEETLAISGPLRARQGTDIATQEAGVVESVAHDKGDVVRAGQTLVLLERDMLAAERATAEAVFTLRQYNEERTRTLMEANSVSKQEMLIAHTEREQAEQNLRMAQLRYERAAVKAPFAGVVADRRVEVGQLVSPGMVVARLVDPFVLNLEGWVTAREVGWLRVGAPALVSVDGVDKPVHGEVHWISVEADPAVGKFKLEIRIDNADLALRPGVVARARVLKVVHQDVVAVPRDAVVQSRHGESVYVVEGDRAHLRAVVLGPDQGPMVLVREGLTGDEQLVVRGQRDLTPDAAVVVRERTDRRDGTLATDPESVQEQLGDDPRETVVGGGATPR